MDKIDLYHRKRSDRLKKICFILRIVYLNKIVFLKYKSVVLYFLNNNIILLMN